MSGKWTTWPRIRHGVGCKDAALRDVVVHQSRDLGCDGVAICRVVGDRSVEVDQLAVGGDDATKELNPEAGQDGQVQASAAG